jgi:transcriptional regulator with XRE-family HTH domain
LARDPEFRREVAVGRASAALAHLIALRMQAEGVSQAALARRLGITDGALSRKLHQGVDMRLSSIAGILWELGVPLYVELERLCEPDWQEGQTLVSENVVPFSIRRQKRTNVTFAEKSWETGT